MLEKRTNTAQFLTAEYSVILVLAILFVCKISFLFLTFNRGFDLGDEGMHMLLYKFPQEYSVTIYNHHYLVTALFPPSFITVFNMRVIWLVSDAVGWLMLFAGGISFLRSNEVNISKTTAVLFLLFGANALALSIHDRIIGYNALSNLFVNTSAGLFLLALSCKEYTYRHFLLISGSFFFAGLEFFIKPTAAFGVISMEVMLCLVFFRGKSVRLLPSAMIGVVVACTFMFLLVLPSVTIWIHNYLKGAMLAHLNGYGSKLMLVFMYGLPTVGYLVLLLVPNAAIYLLLTGISKRRIITLNYLVILIVAGHLVSCFTVYMVLHLLFSKSQYSFETLKETPDSFFSMVLLLPNTLFYQWLTSRVSFPGFNPLSFNRKAALVCFFLLAIPYVIFFGAFSSFDISIYGHLLPIIALLFMVPYLFTNPVVWSKLKGYYFFFTTLLCSFFFIKHYIFYPTRVLEPLFEQTVNVSQEENILMDSASASFALQLKNKVNDMGSFSYTTQIGMHPGLVYLLGLKQPGNCYFLSFSAINGDLESMNVAFNDYYYQSNFKEIVKGPLLINAGASEMDINVLFMRMKENGYGLLLKDSVYNPYLNREMKANAHIKYPFTYIYMPTINESN